MSWKKYYEKSKGRPLRALYSQAIAFLDSSAKIAMDLGCGSGTEVLDLLNRGFEVHAVDQESMAIEFLTSQATEAQKKLQPHLCSLETLKAWPQTDFLFAYHSFPFCKPDQFDDVVEKALRSVSKKGICAITFFGLEDQWVTENKVMGISADKVKNKLQDFQILHFEAKIELGPTALQGNKMWHVIEVIARRK